MIRCEFQRSRNTGLPRFAGFFVGAALLGAPVSALAETTATAAFPLVAAYAPTPSGRAVFAPTPMYTVARVTPAPAAVQPSAPATAPAGAPTDPSWGVPSAARPADARGDSGGRPEGKDTDADEAWMLALEGYTSVPVDVGARATFETPFRLRLSAAFGIVPGAYFGVVNDVVEESGAYDAFEAEVVEASLDSGRVVRAMIGFRPVAGLYLDTGYARVGLSGALRADQFGYSIDTTLHMWTAEIGYQAKVADRLVLALGLGVMKTFSASSSVEADFELGRSARALAITSDAVDEYDRKLEEYGIVPTLTARIGWDFF
jgi:hypothetical protein